MSVNVELIQAHFPQLNDPELLRAIADVGEVKEVQAGDALIETGQ